MLCMSFKHIEHQLKHIGKLMATLSERVDANTTALQAISDKLDSIIANPPSTAELKAQLTQIKTDLGDTSDAVTETAVAAAAAPATTITPTA